MMPWDSKGCKSDWEERKITELTLLNRLQKASYTNGHSQCLGNPRNFSLHPNKLFKGKVRRKLRGKKTPVEF